jgi:hypothetical protein
VASLSTEKRKKAEIIYYFAESFNWYFDEREKAAWISGSAHNVFMAEAAVESYLAL